MRPNVVLTEICIRGMNGLELIKKIKEKIPAIQFIVVSAYAEFGYVQKAVNNGAVGYCLKSFDDGEC
jgi:two-component system response regulator YesN